MLIDSGAIFGITRFSYGALCKLFLYQLPDFYFSVRQWGGGGSDYPLPSVLYEVVRFDEICAYSAM